jgi:hypothetical protein
VHECLSERNEPSDVIDHVVNQSLTCDDARTRRSATSCYLRIHQEFDRRDGVSGINTPAR